MATAYTQGCNKKWDFSHSWNTEWKHCDAVFLPIVVHFILLLIKKLVVINSFCNSEFSFYCLHTFLPFLQGFSIINSPWIQVGCTLLALQTSYIASSVFSAPFIRGKYLLKFSFFVWHWKGKQLWWQKFGGKGWNSQRSRRQAQEEKSLEPLNRNLRLGTSGMCS